MKQNIHNAFNDSDNDNDVGTVTDSKGSLGRVEDTKSWFKSEYNLDEVETSEKHQNVGDDLNAKDLFGVAQENTDKQRPPLGAAVSRDVAVSDEVSGWDIVNEEGGREAKELADRGLAEWIADIDQDHFLSYRGTNVCVYRESENEGRRILDVRSIKAWVEFNSTKKYRYIGSNNVSEFRPVAPVWIKLTARRYEQFVFDPSNRHRPDQYNLWCGFGVERKTYDPDQIKLIVEQLILRVLCNRDSANADYFIKWLAHGVQIPWIKPGVATVLKGLQGTGKGTIGRLMLKLWGVHGITVAHSKHITGNFNQHLQNVVFVFSDEAQFVGDHAGNQAMKALITEPFGIVEAKGVDAVLSRNYVRLLIATNSDRVLDIGADSRRFFVLNVSSEIRGGTSAEADSFWYEINQYIDSDGAEEFLDYLLKVDLTGFKPQHFPETEGLKAERLGSIDAVTQTLIDMIEHGHENLNKQDGAVNFEIRKEHFFEAVQKTVKFGGYYAASYKSNRVGALLAKLGATSAYPRHLSRQVPYFVLPPLDDLKRKIVEVNCLPESTFSSYETVGKSD